MNEQERAYFEQFSGLDEKPQYILLVKGVSLKNLQKVAFEEMMKEVRKILQSPDTKILKISDK